MNRCEWAEQKFEAYKKYHDLEWGVPVWDDKTHFEFLILESAQAGLSWSTVLKKRAGYEMAFANFDIEQVALFDENKIQELVQFDQIIRNRAKIRAAVNNAQKFIAIQKEFGSFSKYIWSFTNGEVIVGNWKNKEQIPVTTSESDALSTDLKIRGFKFVGSTIMYAHMQATGLVNDHTVDCFRYKELLS
ncbi:MAG: DNA-3-methyladenine glycosylase I [Reichenbachiella sp.]